jgi:hypothetical protein
MFSEINQLLNLARYSLLHVSGTFIARQSRFIPCGYTIASMSMLLKFLIGPVVMLIASLVVGMHGTMLHMAVVQVSTKNSLFLVIDIGSNSLKRDVQQ